MRLKHIAIRNLAGIGQVAFPDLDPGLNVFVGDNEAGKSTVLTALRAAIFHRHGSGSRFVKDLAPYAGAGRPEIDLDFSLGDLDYRLEKRFLQKAEARLTSSAGDWAGEAVEEKLAQLFGFSPYSGRGDFEREKHTGTFGLLWVEQGRSTHGLDLGAGRDAVATSLEAEVGQILGGDRGRELVAAAKALRDQHFTAGGKVAANSELAAAEKEVAALDARLNEREATRRALDASIDQLARQRGIVTDYRRDRVIETASEAVERAEAAERALESRRRDLTEAEQALQIAAAAVERAAGERERRLELKAAVQAATEAYEAASLRLTSAHEALAELGARAGSLQAEQAAADSHRSALEAEVRLAKEASRRGDIALRLERTRETLAASRQAAARIAKARAVLAEGALDERSLKAILAAETARREAAIGRDAGAPSLLFHPDAGQAVLLDGNEGASLDPQAPVRVTRRSRFHLGGFGSIEVLPDAASQTREADYRKAAALLASRLAEAGVADIEAAVRRREETRAAEAEIREAGIELKARAPGGLAEIEAEEQALARELAERSDALPQAARDMATLQHELVAAVERQRTGEQALEHWRAAERDARVGVARAESLRETATADCDRLARRLSEAAGLNTDGALAERLAGAEMMRVAKSAVLDRLRTAYEAADPAAIRRDLEHAQGALRHVCRDLSDVESVILHLEAEIRQTGGLAIGEEIARLEAERQEAGERLARLRLQADAARLLHETLKAAEARVRKTWFAPIRREVEPYLRLIHPESEVALDDATLAITGLTRRGVEEDFMRLSSGAREQVAVVTRLALAHVLKRGGHPAAVILDDALVNTDEKRLERMHEVLRRASEDLQIIVLTCRERDFRGLGRVFRL